MNGPRQMPSDQAVPVRSCVVLAVEDRPPRGEVEGGAGRGLARRLAELLRM